MRATFEEVTGNPEARTKIKFVLRDLPAAEGDAALVRQVWLNLLSNAVKFSVRDEKPVIEVSAGFDMAYVDKPLACSNG